MKKILLLAIAIVCVILLKAQSETTPARVITLNEYFESIKVGDGVKIILTEGRDKNIVIIGRAELIVTVANSVLLIKKQWCCKQGPVTVFISVQGLKSIELNEGSSVFSNGQLQSDELTVHINGTGYIDLRSTGKVNLLYDEYLELDVKRVKNKNLFSAEAAR